MTHPPFQVLGADRPGRWLISCDHADNHVPDWIAGGDLGIDAADMGRHIAWDVGAAGVAIALAELLDSPCVLSGFSRLVIDPNRGEDDPTLVMRLYDGTIIPANRHAGPAQIEERLERLYRPYHDALASLMPGRALCAMHSFTPQLRGRAPRPWHVGVLHSPIDSRLSLALIDQLQAEADLCVGDNEPYSGHLPGDSVDRHALQRGHHNVLIELRNDLIGTADEQRAWAARLAPLLVRARAAVTPG